MTIYLVRTYNNNNNFTNFITRAFTCKQLAEEFMIQANKQLPGIMHSEVQEIELITDQFMEQILQPKESHETNTNSSL